MADLPISGEKRMDQPDLLKTVKDMMKHTAFTGEEPTQADSFLSVVINAISDPLFVKDSDHRRVLVNDSYCRFTGRSRAEILGTSDHELYRPELAEKLGQQDRHIFETGKDMTVEETLSDASGSLRTFLTKKCLYTDKKGNRFIVGIARDITTRKDVEELLAGAKADWEETFNTLGEAITIHDTDFRILRANSAAEKILGLPFARISARKCYQSFHGTDGPPAGCPSCEVLKTGKPTSVEMFEPHLGKFIQLKALPRFDKNKQIIGIVHIARDISELKKGEEEQKRLQAQFMQAQKMESVGRLASGIAHDFNNILSAIIGYSELALLNLPADHALTEQLIMINEAGAKAAELTRQLLAFSRQQVLEMKVVEINSVIGQTAKMLRPVIGEDITLELDLKADPGTVLADPNQIEQVLLNLTVNARDAMPEGGKLIIETANAVIDENGRQQRPEMKTGAYAMFAVSDTGTGMSKEVRGKIFEPFFTTKAMGKGTGLGLATVYGIIKQHNGFIYVYSEPGSGTTFKIYLPLTTEAVTRTSGPLTLPLLPGSETILIVDDESSVSKLAGAVLRPLGYRVLEASNCRDALELARSGSEKIDLVLTDVIMPGTNGNDLAKVLEREQPGIKIIFMSGYTDDVIAHRGVLNKGVNFIQKPLTPSLLTKKLREVLDSGKK